MRRIFFRSRRYAMIAFGGSLLVLVTMWRYGPDLSLPRLLRDLPATGGWIDACPSPFKVAVADAPEFNRRLLHEFPVGSSESHLIAALDRLGFKIFGHCKDDPSIHSAVFDQTGFALRIFPLHAKVQWKTDAEKNVLWTKGFISYDGP